jgi:serine/threonine protein kinase, bacterial
VAGQDAADGTPFGRYRLIELVGRGGMGEVWRAYDPTMDRVVALKLLPANFANDRVFQERFRREAKAAAGLDEPHVVPIYEFGEIEGRLYVTMRLIKGRDLQTILANGPLAPARAVAIIEQVAQALHAAHRVGLVHRDIKPSNILLDDNDFAYLIDFGIARAAGQTGLTSTGATIGTWSYMSPERFQSGTADARADIYALACVLYEALTGQPPFPGDSLEQIAVAHMLQPPPRPSQQQDGVPAAMDKVIATGMAKNPEQRYATTMELARAAHDATTVPLAGRGPAVPVHPPTPPDQLTAGPIHGQHTQLRPEQQLPAYPGRLGSAATEPADWTNRPPTQLAPAGPLLQPARPTKTGVRGLSRRTKIALIAGAVALVVVIAAAVGIPAIVGHRPPSQTASNSGGSSPAQEGRHQNLVATKVTATIPVGESPQGVVVDPGTHAVNVTNAVANGTMSVIDPATHTVTATIPVGKFPLSVVVDPATHTVYVANADIFPSTPDASTVSVIDPATRTVTATIPVGNTPEAVVVDPATHTLYTVNFGAYAVKVIDPATRTVIAQIRVGRGPVSVAIDPGTNTLYTTNILENTVSVIDLATHTVTATIPVGNTPTSVAVDPGTHTVYVTNGSHYYVQGSDNTVSVIDPHSRTVTSIIPVGTDPTSVAVDPGTHTAYIANRGNNTVSVIDPATRTVTATIPVGNYPDGIAVDPGPHAVYVANGRENTVTVIEPER